MSAPAIPDEATKPTSNGKTSVAVDKLVGTGGRQVLELSLDQLIPHPDNPREQLGDLTELAASIRAGGILEPLIVISAQAFGIDRDNGYVILAGHRRAAAAAIADHGTAPCIVRDDLAGPEGRAMMLVENMQREGLNALEESAGFEVLRGEPFRWSQERIAEAVGKSQSHVSKRLTLQKLPNAIRARIDTGDNSGGCITLEQAAEIARQPAAVQTDIAERIGKVKQPRSMYEVADSIRWAVRDHERNKVQQSALKKLRELGIPVLNADGNEITGRVTYSQTDGPCPINWLPALSEDLAAHAALPCHAAVIGSEQVSYDDDLEPEARWISYVCTDPVSHPEPEPGFVPPRDLTPEQLEEQKLYEERRARRERLSEVNARRCEYIRTLVTGPKTPKDAASYVVLSTVAGGYFDPYDLYHDRSGFFEADDEKIRSLLAAAIDALNPNVTHETALRWALYQRLYVDDACIRSVLLHDGEEAEPSTSMLARISLHYLASTGYEPSDEEKPILADQTTAAEYAADAGIPGFEAAEEASTETTTSPED